MAQLFGVKPIATSQMSTVKAIRSDSPLVTLWVFLGQILSSDQSCTAAVARLIAHRISRKLSPCSSETSVYCQARKRLPDKFFSDVARRAGRALDCCVKAEWLWHGRRVYLYDGSTVTMPDTAANQSEYPQPSYQRPGLGRPMTRVCAIFSLSCGAVVDMAIPLKESGNGKTVKVLCSDIANEPPVHLATYTCRNLARMLVQRNHWSWQLFSTLIGFFPGFSGQYTLSFQQTSFWEIALEIDSSERISINGSPPPCMNCRRKKLVCSRKRLWFKLPIVKASLPKMKLW